MYLDLSEDRFGDGHGRFTPNWTVLIPFFNERDYLGGTIESLARQSVPFTLVLIDNGSTDDSKAVAEAACRAHGLDYLLITERTIGKVAALRTGLSWVRTRWVATCDADTYYPPHYLAMAEQVLRRPGHVVAGAYYIDPSMSDFARLRRATTILAAARLMPRQSHTGGAGQAFCTQSLREAGGFDMARWNFVLEDHEIIHRMMRKGSMGYAEALWCMPSLRERDRDSIRWTLVERLLYSAVAPWAGDWFFYRFLAGRLQQRRLLSHRIRERQYQTIESPVLATSHAVR